MQRSMRVQQPEFDFKRGKARRDIGRDLAAAKRAELLREAQDIAVSIALGRPDHTCTADEVQGELLRRGYPTGALGNAAGSIFRGKRWQHTGYRQSRRTKRHAGLNRVWTLVS